MNIKLCTTVVKLIQFHFILLIMTGAALHARAQAIDTTITNQSPWDVEVSIVAKKQCSNGLTSSTSDITITATLPAKTQFIIPQSTQTPNCTTTIATMDVTTLFADGTKFTKSFTLDPTEKNYVIGSNQMRYSSNFTLPDNFLSVQ